MTPVPLRAALGSELTKLRTLRSTWVTAGLAVGLAVAASVLLSVVTGATFDDWSPAERADYQPILFALFGQLFSSVCLTVLAVNAGAAEYATGMIRVTLTATPQRGRLLVAKVLAVGLFTLASGTVATVAMFLASQAVLSSYDLPTAGLTDGDAVRAVLISSLASPVLPLIGLALALLLRSTAGAVASVLGLMFAPLIFFGLLPESWQDRVNAVLPSPAIDSAAISHIDTTDTAMDAPGGIAVVLAWVVVSVVVGHLALTRRDA